MNVEAPMARQGSAPDPAQDMAALAAETESLLPYKQVIVKALIAVAAEEKQEAAALEELLAEIPEPLWPAVRRRFFYEIGVIAEKKKERAPRPPGIVITGALFDMAAAILLMATGTYETIRDFLRDRLEFQTQIKEMGATLLRHGVTPDMKMVEKLQRIILQAQQIERERLEEQQQKRESA